MMDLDELRSVQSRERQTDSLQQLRGSFYRDAGAFIEGLREERERAAERADDPWNDPEISRLSDDIETAEDTVEAIYERRVGKTVKMASLAAADMPIDDEGLTAEERQLFDVLVAEIEKSRERVDAILDGDGTADTETDTDADTDADADAETDIEPHEDAPGGPDDDQPDTPTGAGPDTSTGTKPAPSPGPDRTTTGSEPEREPHGEKRRPADRTPETRREGAEVGTTDVDRSTVRIMADVGEIFGVEGRSYDLAASDVVTLPEANAEPLIERGAAERLD